MGRVVLVTGASRYLGGRLARLLLREPGVARVVGVDIVPPKDDLGDVEFVRADIRSPLIAKVLAAAGVDTLVHMSVMAAPVGSGGRSSMKETNVIGTMQLLAACQRTPTVRRLVLKSSTAVYGSSARDPAFFTEETEPRAVPRRGYDKDVVEVETYVRGFTRRRPDVDVTLLRFANFVGPGVETPLTSYFTLPVVPTVLGFDARLQFIHEADALEVLRRSVVGHHPGTFNVAGDGVIMLSQAIRRAGRLGVSVPPPAVHVLGRLFHRARLADFSPAQVRLLTHGRCVDTTRLRTEFDFVPRSTVEAFDDFVRARRLHRLLPVQPLARAEAALSDPGGARDA